MKQKRFIFTLILFALLVPIAVSAYYDNPEEVDKRITKDGYIAAVNPDKLTEAIGYKEQNNLSALQTMLKNGEIILTKGGTIVEVVAFAHSWSRIRIKLPDGKLYWVKEDALTKIE